MEEVMKVRTACRSCHGGCGVIAHVKEGRVIKVEGDPDSPISHGTMCTKGLSITQLAYHPDRVLYPMKKSNGVSLRGRWTKSGRRNHHQWLVAGEFGGTIPRRDVARRGGGDGDLGDWFVELLQALCQRTVAG